MYMGGVSRFANSWSVTWPHPTHTRPVSVRPPQAHELRQNHFELLKSQRKGAVFLVYGMIIHRYGEACRHTWLHCEFRTIECSWSHLWQLARTCDAVTWPWRHVRLRAPQTKHTTFKTKKAHRLTPKPQILYCHFSA